MTLHQMAQEQTWLYGPCVCILNHDGLRDKHVSLGPDTTVKVFLGVSKMYRIYKTDWVFLNKNGFY